MKKISDFMSKNFLFLEMKISIYLNRRVFVMSVSLQKLLTFFFFFFFFFFFRLAKISLYLPYFKIKIK